MAVISGSIIGGLKVALKSAAKKVGEQALKEVAKGGAKALTNKAVQESLKNVATKAMTDGQAVLLNRLKSAPTKALWDFTANELGLPVKEVRKIVKQFNQSKKAKDFALGQNFKDTARSKLKKELKTNINDNIKDMVKKAKKINQKRKEFTEVEYDKEKEKSKINFSNMVYGILLSLEKALHTKVNGMSTAKNKFKKDETINVQLTHLFNDDKEYQYKHARLLEKILGDIEKELDEYIGGDDEVVLLETAPNSWSVYSKRVILEFVSDRMDSVERILDID